MEVPADDPSAAQAQADHWLSDGFDVVGKVSGTVENVKLEPSLCNVKAAQAVSPDRIGGSATSAFATLSAGGCVAGDLRLDAVATADRGLAGSLSAAAIDTGNGPVTVCAITVVIIVVGPIIVIIIIF